jgi:hypothetical protein
MLLSWQRRSHVSGCCRFTKERTVKRLGDRSGRVLDAIVIVLAVPTVAIAATLGLREYDGAQSHAMESRRIALAHCDAMSGLARLACRTDARAARRSGPANAMPTDDELTQSAGVADVLARAQCGVLTGYAAGACAGAGSPDRAISRAQPVVPVVADRGARRVDSAAERRAAR